jgi:cytochrome b
MSERLRVWDLPVRVFHWLLACSFAAAYLVAESEQLRGLHVILGYTATGLILFRIVWGFLGSHFARFRSFVFPPKATIEYLRSLRSRQPQHFLGHTPADSYSIYAILLVGLATGVTGYMSLNAVGGGSTEAIHEVCANVWLGLVIVHVAGVVIGSWIHRENLVRAMITGYKKGVQGQQEVQGIPVSAGRAVGVSLATAVAAFWLWSLLTGSVPGASEHGAREQAEGRKQGSEQTHEGRLSEPKRFSAEKPDSEKY